MKNIRVFFIAIIIIILLLNCPGKKSIKDKDLKIGMIISVGGIGDRAFNDSAINGLNKIQEKYKFSCKYVDYYTENKNIENLRIFAEEGYDLIIGVGFFNLNAIESVAKEFPEKNYAIIDIQSENKNIYSAVFQEEEASFLVGILSAIKTKKNIIGFLGGAPIPVVENVRRAYIAGAKYINPDIKVYCEIAGTFDDPLKGYELGNKLFKKNCDIVYSGAGKTGVGLITAGIETGNYVIGTDTDQVYLGPKTVIGSRMKNIDVVILDMMDKYLKGKFKGGIYKYGLKENGLYVLLNDKLISNEEKEKFESIKKDIMENKINVFELINKIE